MAAAAAADAGQARADGEYPNYDEDVGEQVGKRLTSASAVISRDGVAQRCSVSAYDCVKPRECGMVVAVQTIL